MSSLASTPRAEAGPSAPVARRDQLLIENLEFFYGENRALHGINMKVPENRVRPPWWPVGLRQVGLPRAQRCLTSIRASGAGTVMLDSEDIL